METVFPLFTNGFISSNLNYILAIGIGILFGFILERGGFGTSAHIAPVFYFRSTIVPKIMVSAIITTATLILLGTLFGYIDFSQIFIPTTYLWPYLVGGVIFGLGMVMSGWCPGTAVVGIATLKIDAIFFALGLLVGMFFYFDIYQYIIDFANSGNLGKFTIDKLVGGDIRISYLVTVAVSFALLLFVMSMKKLKDKQGEN